MIVARYKHRFTHSGIKLFEDLTTADIFHALDKPEGAAPQFKITIGRHEIAIPNDADNYEDLIIFLENIIKKEEK